ncbi:hypothetical protein BJ138DRAFT_1118516 [Hygrophoropsis aurantiaca]|uniref:Uncharacterized protein n=1 Tax=Hygrophoropsis aurantiaca TaxID=72124 RepID=A0ACB7ZXC7_9AGAM|nr:hypothetical protein BJ138DRAFT_1118516 [Hygrophoropsis aurantiaca]
MSKKKKIDHSESQARSQQPPEDVLDAPRRSSRQNRGRGGAVVQLKAIEAVQTRIAPSTKSTAAQVARDSQPRNPMAPPSKTKKAPRSVLRREASNEPPQQMSLAGPTKQKAAQDSRFGFRITSSSGLPQASSPKPSKNKVPVLQSIESSDEELFRRPISNPAYTKSINTGKGKRHQEDDDDSEGGKGQVDGDRDDEDDEGVPKVHIDFRTLSQQNRKASGSDESMEDMLPRDVCDGEDEEQDDDEQDGEEQANFNAQADVEVGDPGEDDPMGIHEDELEENQAEEPEAERQRVLKRRRVIPSDNEAEPEDVLNNHHRKNGAPRAPAPSMLDDVRRRAATLSSGLGAGRLRASNDANNDQDDDQDTDPADEPPKRKGGKYSKTPRNQIAPKPTQQSFYPPAWRDTLDRAKLISRMDSLDDWFPVRDAFIAGPAQEYLAEAIAIVEDSGMELDPYYWDNHKMDMAKLLFDDLGTFRSEVKKDARRVVKAKCPIFPDDDEDPPDYDDYVRQSAANLLDGGLYLQGGKDENGRTDNFASVYLRDLVETAFYQGKLSLAAHFPEKFSKEVPKGAIIVAGTALKGALDEYEDGAAKDKKFTVEHYSPVYDTLTTLLDEVDKNPYHSRKCRKLRCTWAATLMSRHHRNGQKRHHLGFKVALD